MALYKQVVTSPIGKISLIADRQALVGTYLEGQSYFEKGFETEEILHQPNVLLDQATEWLRAYFNKQEKALPPMAPRGTFFQQRVWKVVQGIPIGQTMTYGRIAQVLNCKSAQAVGSAIGKNPLSFFIPCHRVLGQGDRLIGYAGGLDKKIWLLNHEGALYQEE